MEGGDPMIVKSINCDMCECDVDSGTWMTLHGADLRPLDFCSWDCVADYARVTAYAMEPQLEPPC